MVPGFFILYSLKFFFFAVANNHVIKLRYLNKISFDAILDFFDRSNNFCRHCKQIRTRAFKIIQLR